MITPIRLSPDGLEVLDQRLLPTEEVWLDCSSFDSCLEAIRDMQVRGAPAIGIVAAFGMAQLIRDRHVSVGSVRKQDMDFAARLIMATRPTAVNLEWAVIRMVAWFDAYEDTGSDLGDDAMQEAMAIWTEDIEMCKKIGHHGGPLLDNCAQVLTHCNAGALATGGYGTALGVIRAAHAKNKSLLVFADETRPYLQGSRITAYELNKDGINVIVVPDSAAHSMMLKGDIDAIVVGADRIAANGDVANKIGTVGLALTADRLDIPFYVAAPSSTVDISSPSGGSIIIEERSGEELRKFNGKRVMPEKAGTFNPAFDITLAKWITSIITEDGVFEPEALCDFYGPHGPPA